MWLRSPPQNFLSAGAEPPTSEIANLSLHADFFSKLGLFPSGRAHAALPLLQCAHDAPAIFPDWAPGSLRGLSRGPPGATGNVRTIGRRFPRNYFARKREGANHRAAHRR